MKLCSTPRATVLLPVLLGILAFFIVVGPRALDPTNIAWLGDGDPATHYQGWVFFRHSPWSFPLGLNPSYGLELSNGLIFSDSNPLFAFLFKPFSALLPEPFQYFGLWLLTCFVLQSWFAWKLLGLLTRDSVLKLLGAGLFVFIPAMLIRMSVHLSLGGHFMLLAALYLALRPFTPKRCLAWGTLLAVAALVHAYLLAMIALIWLADLAAHTLRRHLAPGKALGELVGLFLLVSLCCWQAGYFSVGDDGLALMGYGLFRANVLSFLDPGEWSFALRDMPGVLGDGDGFAFLGLGVVFLLICAFLAWLQRGTDVGIKARRYPLLLLALAGLGLFAVSNNVGVGPFELHIPLPDALVAVATIFRGSGRMVWPVMYMAIFAILYVVIRGHASRTARVLLSIALLLQVADTRSGWGESRKLFMVTPASQWKTPLVDPFWDQAARHYQAVRWLRPENYPEQWITLAEFAGRHHLPTNAVYLGRVSTRATEAAQAVSDQMVSSGRYAADTLYVLDSRSVLPAALTLNRETDVLARIDGLNVLAPGWKRCAECTPITAVDPLTLISSLKPDARVTFDVTSLATFFLGNGWSKSEPWGTWSEGDESQIILRPEALVKSFLLEANALIAQSHNEQSLEIFVNEVPVLSTRLRKPEANIVKVDLPADVQERIEREGVLVIRFRYANAITPRALGMGLDPRKLAIGIRALTLH
ncbi:hypothetical protein HU727_000500 [Pseudomonas sp. SWRI153]|uniref:Uncharacterized protein n=1 Tax=Pseudomonas khorasanensis TaxID=2745508 RepID=A0A923JFA6_9PSED|nr:DUF6311 domain-containing protein [Pseudomonas khorasanensis]MBV4484062.1 hypothetical protein [Pseudomonas khorasanensis]